MKITVSIALVLTLSFALFGISWPAPHGSDGPGASSRTQGVAPSPFHSAQTAPEQALGRILDLGLGDGIISGYPSERPRLAPPADAPYLKFVTRALTRSILVDEAGRVQKACNGIYKPDASCGMEFDPIICGFDPPDHYLFRTTQSSPRLAVIEAARPPDANESGARPSGGIYYRLILDGRAWKIDGIFCARSFTFNW